ncbi:contractile injection system tape measure protein [Fluviicola taffensis]|uniref:contractile injection system tape measure protein n=1 Tax=Fluviicola taffensis TaxID=191579 RepID=UPI003137C8F2
MNTETQHIVHKLIVEVETNSKEKGIALKDNAAGFVSGGLSPVLEELFEELEKKLNGRVLTLESLSIQVSAASTDLTYGDIDRLIGSAIREEIEAQIPLAPGQLISVPKRQLQSIFHFLKTGTKPWWLTNNTSLNQLMETNNLLELAVTDTETLVRELHSNNTESFLKRLVLQLPETVLIEWFTRAFHFPEKLPDLPAKIPIRFPDEATKRNWWISLFQAFYEFRQTGRISPDKAEELIALIAFKQEADPETLVRFVRSITGEAIPLKREKMIRILQDNREKKISSKEEKRIEQGKKTDETETTDFHTPVENAGLILLHPFLNPFFTEIGLLEGDQLTDPELAVHVLHYLATGQENSREYELQFEKFLCGIPEDEPIRQELPLSKEIKEEAENLLDAVLEHWTALRSDSPELLRNEFLQREAKIIIEEFQSTRLVFERKAQDILLEKLPWNLGIVKIDWRKDLLFVEW